MYTRSISADKTFLQAAELYMKQRSIDALPGALTARYIKQNTEKSYWCYVRSLALFFGSMPLGAIHIGNIKAYQAARIGGLDPFIRRRRPHEEPKACPTKPAAVNQELCFLRAIMRRAGAWTEELEELYEELIEEEAEVPRSLTPEEQGRWLHVAALRERWSLVRWYSLAAFETTASTNELRGLRLGDVNLHHQLISVPWPASKNKYRHRSIAVEGADALWALEQLIERARALGASRPQDFLFPFRDPRANAFVPERPMTGSGLKKLWQEVRTASGLLWFRPYDTRHTGITRMAEDGIPIEIIKAKAGHISDRMSRHYTHISLAAQRRWMRVASERKIPPQREEERPPSARFRRSY